MSLQDHPLPERTISASEILASENSRESGRRRSVYSKYMTAFVLILLACFLMLAAIITGVLGSYARNSKVTLTTSAAEKIEQYVENSMRESGGKDMGSFLQLELDHLRTITAILCDSADGDFTIFLTDASGNVLFLMNREGEIPVEGVLLPENLIKDVLRGIEISGVSTIEGIMPEQQLVRTETVETTDGELVGIVFACSGSDSVMLLLNHMLKTLILAGIWIVLVAIVIVYFLTKKITSPLHEMSRAAKSFASGNFEVVIPVRGNDEIAELALALNHMGESLKNLEKMRSAFMANVSHDLRTPMTTIGGFVDSILAGAIPPEKQPHYLELISGEVKRLSRLVSLTLDISRIQAGDRKFVMEQFDICELARLILISFEQKIDLKYLDVAFDCDDDHMMVYADRDAIHQILYNICDNAVKFSRDGGKLEIAVRAQRDTRKVQVTVFNEGQGIPEEDIPYIFDQFYKADKSRGLDKSGVGLGMFISKAIIDAHKEEIWVHSAYGENCEFGFTLSAKPIPQNTENTTLL